MRKQVSISENSVGTLARGLDVLELFATAGAELSQKEISAALGLPMPTVHRLTAVLTERGWIDRDPASRRLRLGMEMARLMPALMAGMRLPELVRPHLIRLAAELQETVNAAVLQGSEVVYLLSESGDRLLTPQVTVGMRLPAHCTALGKCLLAQVPEDAARQIMGEEPFEQLTRRTLTTWPELRPHLEEIRVSGVAVSEEEFEIGLVSIAVPITGPDGPRTAAINVSLPTARATPPFRRQLTQGLLDAARAIDRSQSLAGSRR